MFPQFADMLAQWRKEIDAKAAAGEPGPAQSHAESVPLILYRDPSRVSASLDDLPATVRERVDQRPHQLVVETSVENLRARKLLEDWEMTQFIERGFFIQFALARQFPVHQRGRRQLDVAEQGLREALALWVWALMPSIDYLAALLPGGTEESVEPGLALLADTAPALCVIARDSLAKRPDPSAPDGPLDSVSLLHGLLPRLFDQGRRPRVSLGHEHGPAREFHAKNLQDVLLASVRGQIMKRRDPSLAAPWLAIRVAVIETLAKSCLAAGTLAEAEPAAARALQSGMDRLERDERGALSIVSDPGASKRQHNAAQKILRAVRMKEYVQALSAGATISFDAGELALVAFFSGVDPYLFCAQNMLFAREVVAVRDMGHCLLGRSATTPPGLGLIQDLIAWDPAARPPEDEWEEQLKRIRNAAESAISVIRIL